MLGKPSTIDALWSFPLQLPCQRASSFTFLVLTTWMPCTSAEPSHSRSRPPHARLAHPHLGSTRGWFAFWKFLIILKFSKHVLNHVELVNLVLLEVDIVYLTHPGARFLSLSMPISLARSFISCLQIHSFTSWGKMDPRVNASILVISCNPQVKPTALISKKHKKPRLSGNTHVVFVDLAKGLLLGEEGATRFIPARLQVAYILASVLASDANKSSSLSSLNRSRESRAIASKGSWKLPSIILLAWRCKIIGPDFGLPRALISFLLAIDALALSPRVIRSSNCHVSCFMAMIACTAASSNASSLRSQSLSRMSEFKRAGPLAHLQSVPAMELDSTKAWNCNKYVGTSNHTR